MKKKFVFAPFFAVVLSALTLVGCGGQQDDGDYSKYVTLGNLDDFKVTQIHSTVSEREIREYKEDALSEYLDYEPVDEVTYGNSVDCYITIKEGAEVLYDFTGEDNSYEFIVGDAEFGSELDTQLIGKKVGDEFSFTAKVEDGFEDTTLAGKDVFCEVEVIGITKIVYPDVTDSFVKENFECNTVDEWKQMIKDEAQADLDAENDATFRDEVAKTFADRCTFSGYSDSLYKKMLDAYESELVEYADMFGCSVQEIYDMFETTHADLEAQALEATNEQMALEVWLDSIGYKFTDKDYQEKASIFAEEAGYDSVEEMEADYEKEDLKTSFIRDKAIDFLIESSIINVVEK